MKTLHLMRHGKSSWETENGKDIDRPLLERGVQNTYAMANRFLKQYPKPDLIVSSFANRAIHTANIFARGINYAVDKIIISEKIYEASNNDVLNIVLATSNSVNNLMLVGHNPSFTDIANFYLKPEIDNLHTSGIVSIEFNCDNWNDIQHSDYKVKFFSPKTNE